MKSVTENQLQYTTDMILQFFYELELGPSNKLWILMLHLQVKFCLPNVMSENVLSTGFMCER